ncbi:arginine permease, putative [Cordyceps militaris CM01]|uniref:Arginine permease, putative n=1 Tax=Cordyceps militaris (strain CM01) TaxID=983644 RepID=G3JPI9_CORMM|nr:arginine permease, putative [Cordyceps militaris CM01]EGX89799.1 arginine permease, putative [Cordyceps militaris CM01]
MDDRQATNNEPSAEHAPCVPKEKETMPSNTVVLVDSGTDCMESATSAEGLHRDMSIATMFLLGLSGGIGTALFVSIGGPLNSAGPGGLLLAFLIYGINLALINSAMAEMSTYMPVSGGFIRLAGYWVDDALGFAAGWNFYIYLGLIVPFEITALSQVVSFWSPDIPAAAICATCIILYIAINVFAVRVYSASEFWLCSGKTLLLMMLMVFTVVVMCGGNPDRDAFGFRNWHSPEPFLEYMSTGSIGRFEGVLTALSFASFTCVGPEFVSVAAGEVKHPRTYVKTACKVLFARIILFYIGGCLVVTIVVSPKDKVLEAIYQAGTGQAGGAAASPFIIAMQNLNIRGLPHIITALFLVTIFAAGNTALYSATRCLYGLSLEGRAPKFLSKVNKSGVPIYCFLVTIAFPFLSFLQLSNGTATVLTWLINLATSATLIYYITGLIASICFNRACQAQNFDRNKLPYRCWLQPYGAWVALALEISILLFSGYRTLSPFRVAGFATAYGMPIVFLVLFIGWKVAKKTAFVRAKDVDLIWEAPLVDAYEASSVDAPVGFCRDVWTTLRGFVLRRSKNTAEV